MKFKNLGRILFIVSVLVFIINLFVIYPNKILLVSFIPLFFGVLSFLLLPKYIFAGPGLSIALLVMILRYILSPFLLATSSYSLFFNNLDDNIWITFGLMIFEMLVILIMIRRYSSISIVSNKFTLNNFSYIIPIIFILISIIWSISDPIPISRYNFILSGSDELIKTDLTDSDRGLPSILTYTHYFIIISALFYFYKKSILKNKSYIFLFGFFIVILLTLFYQDSSRNSLLIPLLTVLFLGIKSYSKYKRTIILSLSIIIFLSMSFLSLLKFFNTSDFDKNLVSNDISAQYINDYFGGYYEVFLAVEYSEPIKSKIDNKTLLIDIFGQVVFLNRYIDLENRSTSFYNQTAYNHSHIFPTIGQGYCYFGFVLSWIFTFIVFKFIFLFDKLFYKTTRVDYAFIFALSSVSLGWLHPGSFVLATTILSKFLVFFLILLFSVYIGKKFRYKNVNLINQK